jgi:Na+/H+ antiporter NhaD/arsenite permease-like protein
MPAEKVNITEENSTESLSPRQRKVIFYLGVGGLIFVPIFKTITHLPPFVGILLVLGILWTITETMYSKYDEHDPNGMQKRVSKMLTRIDMPTIMFFLGILMAVGCLQSIGVLTVFGQELNSCTNGNHYLVTGIIGVLSSIMDNVPLVAGCMNMYAVQPIGDFAVDGIFWQLLAYCAGVGGSILIIGSAAGVVIMGLERITFGWYMRHVSWVAFVGYLAGIIYYWLEQLIFYQA